MKQTLFLLFLLVFSASMLGAQGGKAFDVRNAGATGWTVQFADAAAKNKIVDDICASFGYEPRQGDPDALTKNQFAMRQIQHMIAQSVRDGRRRVREKAVPAVDETDIP